MQRSGVTPRRNEMRSDAGSSARVELDQVSRDTLLAITRELTLAQIGRIVIEDRIVLQGSVVAASQSLGVSPGKIYNDKRKWVAGDRKAGKHVG